MLELVQPGRFLVCTVIARLNCNLAGLNHAVNVSENEFSGESGALQNLKLVPSAMASGEDPDVCK